MKFPSLKISLIMIPLVSCFIAAEASANSCVRDGDSCLATIIRQLYNGETKVFRNLPGRCDAVYRLRQGETEAEANKRGPDYFQCTPLKRPE